MGQLPVSDHILPPIVITRLGLDWTGSQQTTSMLTLTSTSDYQLHYETDDWNYILQSTIMNYLPIRNQPDNISLIARQVFANLRDYWPGYCRVINITEISSSSHDFRTGSKCCTSVVVLRAKYE